MRAFILHFVLVLFLSNCSRNITANHYMQLNSVNHDKNTDKEKSSIVASSMQETLHLLSDKNSREEVFNNTEERDKANENLKLMILEFGKKILDDDKIYVIENMWKAAQADVRLKIESRDEMISQVLKKEIIELENKYILELTKIADRNKSEINEVNLKLIQEKEIDKGNQLKILILNREIKEKDARILRIETEDFRNLIKIEERAKFSRESVIMLISGVIPTLSPKFINQCCCSWMPICCCNTLNCCSYIFGTTFLVGGSFYYCYKSETCMPKEKCPCYHQVEMVTDLQNTVELTVGTLSDEIKNNENIVIPSVAVGITVLGCCANQCCCSICCGCFIVKYFSILAGSVVSFLGLYDNIYDKNYISSLKNKSIHIFNTFKSKIWK